MGKGVKRKAKKAKAKAKASDDLKRKLKRMQNDEISLESDNSDRQPEDVPKTKGDSTSDDSASDSSDESSMENTPRNRRTFRGVSANSNNSFPSVISTETNTKKKAQEKKETGIQTKKNNKVENTHHGGGTNVTNPGSKGNVKNVLQERYGKSAPGKVPSSIGQQPRHHSRDSLSSMSQSVNASTATATSKESGKVSAKKRSPEILSSTSHTTGSSQADAVAQGNTTASKKKKDHKNQLSVFKMVIKVYCFPSLKFVCSKKELEALDHNSIAKFMYEHCKPPSLGLEEWWDEWSGDFNREFNKTRENAINQLERVYIGKLPTALSAVQMHDSD